MVKRLINKIDGYLSKQNSLIFIIVITLILYSVAFCGNLCFSLIINKDIIFFDFRPKHDDLILIVLVPLIIAPVFETLLAQSLPYYLLNKFKYLSDHNYLIIIASALFFGLMHFYSLFYLIYAFILGLILMYAYMSRVKGGRKGFLPIAICHSLLNLGILIKNTVSL